MLIRIWADRSLWRLRSSDGLVAGVFTDRRAVLRFAQAEAERRRGSVVCFEPSERLAA